jgi:predicted nucleic acid-binding protein
MKVVVDTSIIIAVILNESSKSKIVQVTKGQE